MILATNGGRIELEHLFAHIGENQGQETALSAVGHLETEASGDAGKLSLYDRMQHAGLSLDELESQLIAEAVRRADGNLASAARQLGITRPQLQYRLKHKATT